VVGRGTAVILALAWGVLGCGSENKEPVEPPTGPFAVSDYFSPTDRQQDALDPTTFRIDQNKNCKERPAGARGACYRITQTSEFIGHAILFWRPTESPGEGLPLPQNLTRISFQVAFEPGSRLIFFYAGASYANESARDDFQLSIGLEPNAEWQRGEMLFTRGVPTSVIHAFGFDFITPGGGENIPATLYLDDLVYE